MATADLFFCSVYRSSRKEGMYLYVPRGADLSELPEALSKVFGKPEHSMDLLFKPGLKLARTTMEEVRQSIDEQGFHLQMPPSDLDGDLFLKGKNPYA